MRRRTIRWEDHEFIPYPKDAATLKKTPKKKHLQDSHLFPGLPHEGGGFTSGFSVAAPFSAASRGTRGPNIRPLEVWYLGGLALLRGESHFAAAECQPGATVCECRAVGVGGTGERRPSRCGTCRTWCKEQRGEPSTFVEHRKHNTADIYGNTFYCVMFKGLGRRVDRWMKVNIQTHYWHIPTVYRKHFACLVVNRLLQCVHYKNITMPLTQSSSIDRQRTLGSNPAQPRTAGHVWYPRQASEGSSRDPLI